MKSLPWLVFLLTLYVSILHASSLYLFTRGFLLTRMALSNITTCHSCTLQPTHSRMVLLIIDALRFDFISPLPATIPSPYHHHILTLPAELTALNPTHSFIFNTFVDPPTTTLQRIKGITTGSLPTFVDMGTNFGGSQISEDSLLLQMDKAGKKIAFMGDDTWTAVYPATFEADMTFPFDSFNVEDLHTVDEGVIANIFPLLQKNMTGKWDCLIGHFLGVDHVGHRLGPDHSTMTVKLAQMNEVLQKVVDFLDDDTLLVVIGDHGMDRTGDHGGDSVHETSAATWIYSKSKPLLNPQVVIPKELIDFAIFPGAPSPSRRIQQIDLIPSLSLLLGLPIPFNNLGSIIPELFSREDHSLLMNALKLNAEQIHAYLDAYRSSPGGHELDTVWDGLTNASSAVLNNQAPDNLVALQGFTRLALMACRSLWAQFNVVLMSLGLMALGVSSVTSWVLYTSSGRNANYWTENGWSIVTKIGLATVVGLVISGFIWKFAPHYITYFEAILVGLVLASSLTLIISVAQRSDFHARHLGVSSIILMVHGISFLSNSFILWEDRILTFLIMTSIIPFVKIALRNPQTDSKQQNLRSRVLAFSALFCLCVRLASISTVCREEQHPYCHVTFYSSSSSPPVLSVLAAILMSILLPSILQKFLAVSASNKGPAPIFLGWGFRIVLIAANVYWILEWLESSENVNIGWLRAIRTGISRMTVGISLLAGSFIWWTSPLCLELTPSKELYGFANSYGSTFMLFLTISYSIINVSQQFTGQLTFALCVVAFFALLEVIDGARDLARPMEKIDDVLSKPDIGSQITFNEIVPVALLSLLAFYSTGHQATMQSLQWKAAFLLTPVMVFYVSLVTVVLNTFGPQLFFAIASPILAQWKVDPIIRISKPDGTSGSQQTATVFTIPQVVLSSLRTALGISFYFSVILFSTASSAAFLRRHLMVWKIFAPRFMYAAIGTLIVDFGIILGVVIGVGRTVSKVQFWFTILLQKPTTEQRI